MSNLGRILAMGWVALLALVLAAPLQAQTPATRQAAGNGNALARAATKPVRPTTAIDRNSCVTAECHPDIKASKVVHGPVAQNACDACHEVVSVEQHTFTVRREKAALCTYCHEFSTAGLPVVHKPVAQGECLGCHDPHGGPTHALTREATTAQLCGRCHESPGKSLRFVHGPVARGACDSCHPPHAAKFPGLLDAVGSDLCLACHREFEPAVTAAKFRHKALDKGCQQCHAAHGSNQPLDLVKPVPDLCYGCHEKMEATIVQATVPHSAVTSDRSCLNCHTAHASNVGKMLTELPAAGCLKCHDKEQKTTRGTVIAAVPQVADPELLKHGELKEGQCSGCHEVHGGTREMLMVKPFSRTFYQPFALQNYMLCFSCHNSALATDQRTTKDTGFRNGDVNLHFVHTNQGAGDENCIVCHRRHASGEPELVRTSLKYGKWDMPIRYEKTDAGGSCFPGCHRRMAYDRDHAIHNDVGVAQTAPAPRVARAERQEGRIVSWTAQDVLGHKTAVPEGGRPAAIVLLSADGKDNATALEQLHNAIPPDAQVVVVLSGKDAVAQARALAEVGPKPPWPVVADAKYEASEALGVRGWPVVLVLRADGLELARVTGSADFLAIKLPPYLRAAAGNADNATLNAELATRPVEITPAVRRTQRDLRIARTLLDNGEPDKALAYLERQAPEPALAAESLALRINALLQLKRVDDAQAALDALPKKQQAEPAYALLRAQVLVAQDRWESARRLAEEALAQDAGLIEAHRLLGRIYEHQQNWPKAAEHYRALSDALTTQPAGEP